ncbi:uncharacterized protein THITE_2055208 [Thermothielavioides terrestris NRRL 8126]|uniref:Uncharacterized protein n=1 Tax=Thermothielavioides terrestris (strain ATCC 38088 / NRRL 8126) TaxID=578455 RepID=G2RD08_THETT|nr:uncharacterized protein THITE_2055208 [Thermothielavioides terrestris NRRL 8126]AEO70701.1 hypothetical protein THITE_2055208 [Thermothielavioides terrestris NRRL 8126]
MLRDYIIVYLNNVLVSLSLNLDFKKYIFVVKEVKYLRYIIEVGVYIYLNLEKIRAIYK